MALSTATITFDIADQLGVDFDSRRTKMWVTTNVPGRTIVDTTGDKIRLGSGNVNVAADGTGTAVVWIPGAGSNPASWQTTFHVDYPDRNAPKGRTTKSFGPFTITANANLADLVAEMPVQPEYLATVLETVQDMVDEATGSTGPALANLSAKISGHTDHGNVSGAVTFSAPNASHRFDATAATTITLAGYSEGDVATLICFSGAEDVTVANAGDVELMDATAWSAEYARGTWVSGGGGGTPAVPDSTPPSAVTGLSATGGEGQVTFNWTAATDAESTVGYRYRVWLTSGGATGEYTTRSSVGPVTVTDLAAGGYTVQVYAYSSGGASATASATATVTAVPGWSVLASDDFTGTNGTMVKGRATPVGGLVWGGDTTPQIQSNAMKWASGVSDAGVVLPLTAAATADGVEVTMTPTLAGEGGGGAPRVQVTFSNTPAFVVEWASGVVSVKVTGYNSSSINTTLVPAENVTAGAPLTFRRVGSIIEALDDGVSVFTYDLTGGYSDYTIAPNSLLVIGYAFQNSSIDNFTARILS